MSLLTKITHHATLFVHPNRKDFVDTLWKELRIESIAHILYDQTVLDIDTARKIILWANTPYASNKIALISFHTSTLPAQNALLKILEEPHIRVKFILVTTNKYTIIDTLYSRLQHLQIEKNITSIKNDEAKTFLGTTHIQRMKLPYIVTLLAAVDEEERKDREGVKTFILSLAMTLGLDSRHSQHISTTLEMAQYAADPSVSGKSILEYLSLLLPQTK